MRDAYFEKTFIFEDSTPVGICLGYDHCAEHEWGVKELKALLGFVQKDIPLGVQDRLIGPLSEPSKKAVFYGTYKDRIAARPGSKAKTESIVAAHLVVSGILLDWNRQQSSDKELKQKVADKTAQWWEKSIYALIQKPTLPFDIKHATARRPVNYELLDGFAPEGSNPGRTPSDPFISAQWDGGGFSVTVWGAKRVALLGELHQALLEGRCTLSLSGSSNPFAGRGLCLVDVSKMSEKAKASVLEKDLAYKALREEVQQSGIEELLKAKGKKYFALEPRKNAQGELMFFLNPHDQHLYNSGWFDVPTLQAWANSNDGPIVKAKAKAA